MVLAVVWLDAWGLTQDALRDRISTSDLWWAVNWRLSSTVRALWLSTDMTVLALDLLHSAALWTTHWRLRLLSQWWSNRLRLLTHHTLVMMRIILGWAILLLAGVLRGVVWLKHSWGAWSLLFGTTYCCILWLRRGRYLLLSCYDRRGLFENQVEVQSGCCNTLFFLDFSIIELH